MHFLGFFAVSLILIVTLQTGSAVDSVPRQVATLHDSYTLGWEVDGAAEIIYFDVKVKTTGFVGFGIAPKSNMNGADIVIGGVYSNGSSYFTDRFSEGTSLPSVDAIQDWKLLHASEDGEFTYLNFSRSLETCDSRDLAITSDTLNVIWSFGATDDIKQHTNRGGQQFNLLDPAAVPFDPLDPSITTWEVRVNDSLPPQETTYFCTVHKFPKFEKKHHMIALEAYLEDENSKRYTHHFTATSCDLKDSEVLKTLKELEGQPGADCYGASYMKIKPKCTAILFGWAVGGKRIVLPEYLGVPVGDETAGEGEEFIMLEMHYDNPQLVRGVQFTSGFNLYFTDKIREQEGSVLWVGHNVLPSLMIPPNQEEFVIAGHCSSEYTREFLPKDGVNVSIVNMHSHLAGRELRVRHFRDGRELPWILSDSHYDFDYQQARVLPQEIKLLPGDHITMECKMSTAGKNEVTTAGEGTRDEMCHVFLFYYPKIDLLGCRSYYPMEKLYAKFGIEAFETPEKITDPVVTKPESMAGKKVAEILNTYNWSSEFVKELQQEMR